MTPAWLLAYWIAVETELRPKRFGDDYSEEVSLRDGSTAVLRLVQADDKALLRDGFDRLSPASRRSRFFATKRRLTEAELRYLTELDGVNHFAIGALRRREDGSLDGLGIGRFVRYPDEPTVAEPAITIADDAQGLGLGTMLLRRLVAAARERGIDTFRCDVLGENSAMQDLLRNTSPQARFEAMGEGVIQVEMPLPSEATPEELPVVAGTPHRAVLTGAARDGLTVVEPPRAIRRDMRRRARKKRREQKP